MDTDDRDYQTWTPEQLIAQIEVLEREKLRLQQIEKISEAQRDLSRSVSTMEYAASGRLRLKSMLLEILRVSNQLLESEESSIFLLDESGVVVESILARGAMIKEHKQSLIGKVLDKGLAGWVMRIKKPGKVEDTKTDERWIELQGQPYTVRSALCVPLIKGKRILGLLTLMHSQTKHFSNPLADEFIETITPQITLALDNLRLTIELSEATEPPEDAPLVTQLPHAGDAAANQQLQELSGMYIITANGKFLYANLRFAEIFSYSFSELVTLDSFFKLVSDMSMSTVHGQLSKCFQNQEPSFSLQFTGKTRHGDALPLILEGHRTRFYGKSAMIGTVRLAKFA